MIFGIFHFEIRQIDGLRNPSVNKHKTNSCLKYLQNLHFTYSLFFILLLSLQRNFYFIP